VSILTLISQILAQKMCFQKPVKRWNHFKVFTHPFNKSTRGCLVPRITIKHQHTWVKQYKLRIEEIGTTQSLTYKSPLQGKCMMTTTSLTKIWPWLNLTKESKLSQISPQKSTKSTYLVQTPPRGGCLRRCNKTHLRQSLSK
jgi:hypothetical protein